MVEQIEALFPGLQGRGYRVTSPTEDIYNCMAWAAGDRQNWWWPGDPELTYWPSGVPRSETFSAFLGAFATLGYAVCENEEYEPNFEKIAVFATGEGVPTHASRQLPNGRWTSKLGRMEDIEHALHDLAGLVYGAVVQILKRPIPAKSEMIEQEGS